jgi:hypothetical protein
VALAPCTQPEHFIHQENNAATSSYRHNNQRVTTSRNNLRRTRIHD